MLTRQFSFRRIEALRPRAAEVAQSFLGDLQAAGPGADLMQAFALPVPSLVICELLGVPYTDREEFQRRCDALLDFTATPEQQRANAREMREYMGIRSQFVVSTASPWQ